MSGEWVFGYGSLVNRATHAYPRAERARLRGWRRVWRHTPLRRLAYLTVEPHPEGEIDGLIAQVPAADWPALDERERAYGRVAVSDTVIHEILPLPQVAVYAIEEGRHGPVTDTHPVLLSYIDIVVEGYLAEFGEDGVQRFFDSTAGWEAPVLDDRTAPVYSRYRPVSDAARDLADAGLKRLSAAVRRA